MSKISLASAKSQKFHGATPYFVDIQFTGPVSVEPRAIGNGHTLVFHFSNAISIAGTVSVVDSAMNSVNATSSPSGNDVIVTIPSLADNKRVTVSLSGVSGPTGAATTQPVSMGFLVGDFNASGTVNASDIAAVKAHSGLSTILSNFKFDVNAVGGITATDVSAVKARAGLVLP